MCHLLHVACFGEAIMISGHRSANDNTGWKCCFWRQRKCTIIRTVVRHFEKKELNIWIQNSYPRGSAHASQNHLLLPIHCLPNKRKYSTDSYVKDGYCCLQIKEVFTCKLQLQMLYWICYVKWQTMNVVANTCTPNSNWETTVPAVSFNGIFSY